MEDYNNGKISVVVTSYNCKNEISRCLDSILDQTFKNLEILVVDDGSTDGTSEIVNSYLPRDSRICFLQKKNEGVSSARNFGLKYATGDVISFIDGDDFLEPDMYETLYSAMNIYNAEIAHCSYNRVYGNEVKPVISDGKVHVQDKSEALRCLIGGYLFVGSLWNKLYRIDLFQNSAFDTSIIVNEDVKMNFDLFRKCHKIVFIDIPKYNYYVRDNSATNTVNDRKKIIDGLNVSKYIFEECDNNKILKNIAAERYMYNLIGAYRFAIFKPDEKISKEQYKAEIGRLYRNISFDNRRIKWNYYGICHMPYLYKLVYRVYDKIRKPNWDIKKK